MVGKSRPNWLCMNIPWKAWMDFFQWVLVPLCLAICLPLPVAPTGTPAVWDPASLSLQLSNKIEFSAL